jgi:hypothetical protein
VFVPAPPGSRPGIIIPAPIGTAPAVVTGAPPVIAPGMRVTANVNSNNTTVRNTTVINNVTNVTNVTIVAPPGATANHQAVNTSVPASAHLAAAQAAVFKAAAPEPTSTKPIPNYRPGQGAVALPPPQRVSNTIPPPRIAQPESRMAPPERTAGPLQSPPAAQVPPPAARPPAAPPPAAPPRPPLQSGAPSPAAHIAGGQGAGGKVVHDEKKPPPKPALKPALKPKPNPKPGEPEKKADQK